MAIRIVTLAYNRPDFIELQLNSLKKWVKEPFEYVVYDNCPDDAIKDECDRLGVTCKPIKIFSADASWCVGLSLDKMWKELQHTKGKLWYVDSDMFLTDDLPNIQADMAYVPQHRGEYSYPWTGLMYFNMDTLPYPEELQWAVNYDLKGTDVGGQNHHYLRTNIVETQSFSMWTLTRDGYSYNGVDCEPLKVHKWLKYIDFAPPFDVLSYDSTPFILHYKSASNYPEFYTPEYNAKKTEQLKKILCQ
jgi:glycosyltransferase involved in cell wall biosynthesis